jgi:hypothetical protein
MKKLLVGTALLAVFTISASAGPLIPASGAAHLTAHSRDIIEVKKWGVPPGWSRGRKVGWRGLGMPPGQAKKMWR